MATATDIRASLEARLQELVVEADALAQEATAIRDAITALGDDTPVTTDPEPTPDHTPRRKVTSKATGKKRGRPAKQVTNTQPVKASNGNSKPAYGETADNILELTEDGWTPKEIAAELDVSLGYVYLIRRQGIQSVA